MQTYLQLYFGVIIYFLTHSGSSYQPPSGKDLRQQGHIRLIRPINYVEM